MLPLTRVVLMVALTSVVGCARSRAISIQAAVCGALSGDSARQPNDFSGMECATAARIRFLPQSGDGAGLPAEHCVMFVDPVTKAANPIGLHDLFGTDRGRQGAPMPLGPLDPAVPFQVEVALYGPFSSPACGEPSMDLPPLLALGRSSVIDLQRDASAIPVPLGYRDACEARDAVTLSATQLETGAAVTLPAFAGFGEIAAYEALTGTQGVCETPAGNKHHGEFRSFPVTRVGDRIMGTFAYDRSRFAGCVAARVARPSGDQYACVGELSSKSTASVAVLTDAHVQQLIAANKGAPSGVLVIRVTDGGVPAVGARVRYDLFEAQNEADYMQDSDFMTFMPLTGVTQAGNGVAIYTNGPTGPYTVTFPDGGTKTFHAGGADDTRSVTTVTVERRL
jgi:hypothetical protein